MENKNRSPWAWVPTLYFTEGLPYVIVMSIAVVMYKRLGLNNTDIALYTSWLYLPWVIKPFWSPVVDMLRTKRWWIVTMQLLVGASMAGVALTLQTPGFVKWSLCFFWLMAFSSATHDIAADGFYMLALNEHEQALNVGIRNTFYRIATIMGQGLLIMGAGNLEVFTQNPRLAWSITMMVAAATLLLLCIYHRFILPRPEQVQAMADNEQLAETADAKPASHSILDVLRDFFEIFADFFEKPQIVVALIFLLIYRLPEALLVKITPLFLLDSLEQGGMALSTSELGFVQGTIGVIGLITGGILGGVAVAHKGFQRWLWPMVLAMSVPNLLYVALAYYQPEHIVLGGLVMNKISIVATSYFIEQFGYGFGFTAYMLYMLYFSQGHSKTAHYAFCTGFMALSMMLPGMVAGWLQEMLGYYQFFVAVIALVPLTFIAASIINVDPQFGKKDATTE